MDPIYKDIIDYIQNSFCAAQAVMIGISAAVVSIGVYTINTCKKINNFRKQLKSKLEDSVEEGEKK